MTSIYPHQQAVTVAFEKHEVAYLVDHMLTDEMRRSGDKPGKRGAATVIRKLVIDAIAAHKQERAAQRFASRQQAMALPASEIAPPTKQQLMAGR
jgi:hypothetical protein